MPLEELEFLQQHPEVPEKLVSAFVAELKRQRAVREGAKRAAEHGVVGQWPTEKRESESNTSR